MFYERELGFFRRILRNIHIDTSLVVFGETSCVKADRGLRDFLNMNDDYEHLMLEMWKNIKSNVIYQFTDDFLCSTGHRADCGTLFSKGDNSPNAA